MAYDCQYCREALARRNLNWLTLNSWLYNEAFTGWASAIAHCLHCLSGAHSRASRLPNPNLSSYQPLAEVVNAHGQGQAADRKSAGVLTREDASSCIAVHVAVHVLCRECFHPHTWSACQNNPQAIQRKRHCYHSLKEAYPKGTLP